MSEELHKSAGSIRVFVHPQIDVLRSAKSDPNSKAILDTQTIDEEMRKCFNVESYINFKSAHYSYPPPTCLPQSAGKPPPSSAISYDK